MSLPKLTKPQKRILDYLTKHPHGITSVMVTADLYAGRGQMEPVVSRIMNLLEAKGLIDGSNRPIENK